MSERKPRRELKDSRPIILLRGGPYNGWCYFLHNWETQRVAAERMGGTHNQETLRYHPTGKFEEHSIYNRQCEVWLYRSL